MKILHSQYSKAACVYKYKPLEAMDVMISFGFLQFEYVTTKKITLIRNFHSETKFHFGLENQIWYVQLHEPS